MLRLKNSSSTNCDPDEAFLKKLMSAKSVKIKLNGEYYYDTKTLSSQQIKAIKDAYDYFMSLGGKIQ